MLGWEGACPPQQPSPVGRVLDGVDALRLEHQASAEGCFEGAHPTGGLLLVLESVGREDMTSCSWRRGKSGPGPPTLLLSGNPPFTVWPGEETQRRQAAPGCGNQSSQARGLTFACSGQLEILSGGSVFFSKWGAT